MLQRAPVLVLAMIGCSDKHPSMGDAAVGAPIDSLVVDVASIDGPVDAPVDAMPDAPPDAPGIDHCGEPSTVLVDVAPSRVSSIALVGDTLYVGAYDYNNGDSNPRVLTYDLTTGQPSASAFALTASRPYFSQGDGEAWTPDYETGTIWRFVPGSSPQQVVTGRPKPGMVTADAGYLYWSEFGPQATSQSVIKRRLISGGTVEDVTCCDSAFDLAIAGNDLYCVEFLDRIVRAPKSGGTATTVPGSVGYPIPSMVRDGNDLFYITLHPFAEVYRVPLPNGPGTRISQLANQESDRYTGLAVSPSYIYISGTSGLRRLNRATSQLVMLHAQTYAYGDPVLWNSEVIFVKQDSQVLRCSR